MTLRSIADFWADFERKARHEVDLDLDEVTQREMWIAFYSGANAAFSLCVSARTTADFQRLQGELQAFLDGPPEGTRQ